MVIVAMPTPMPQTDVAKVLQKKEWRNFVQNPLAKKSRYNLGYSRLCNSVVHFLFRGCGGFQPGGSLSLR
jgi:hypothetical protein